MIISNFRNFLQDESGAYTVWSLVWFSLYVAMGGMAVDMSDAYRAKSLLQSTADASALAAAISLPNQAEGRTEAVAYSQDNMLQNIHGTVLRSTEVTFGDWDFNGSFDPDSASPNAVMVQTRRSRENENMLATNFLRIWGLAAWDVNTVAIAVRFIPDCLGINGLVAGNQAGITSNNNIEELCIHGENMVTDPGQDFAIDLNNNNTFGDGAAVSMPDLDMLNDRPNVCSNNSGLCDPGTLIEGNLIPSAATEANMDLVVNSVITTNNAGEWVLGIHAPDYIGTDSEGDIIPFDDVIQHNLTKDFKGPFEEGYVYVYDNCAPNNIVQLDGGTVIEQVVIYADCRIKANSGLQIKDAWVISTSQGNGSDPLSQHSIDFASGAEIGGVEFCTSTNSEGQVNLYSYASMHIAAGPTVYGLRAVALGDFELTAQGDISGISVEAWNNILATAGGNFQYCGGAFDRETLVFHHRLVY